MTTDQHIARLIRTRVPVNLYASMSWFRKLDADRQHLAHERIGICCGDGDVTPEAYALAKEQVEKDL